ncbi:MAG: prepilin-type N-terminal cleavage/methylation domain-containing protein [Gammaproteobacteria bacterium]|nr:MAG: prepilin-type N-terminal cleavage/methylation domain-containing protein [Gammaproteobacteria bacterium]
MRSHFRRLLGQKGCYPFAYFLDISVKLHSQDPSAFYILTEIPIPDQIIPMKTSSLTRYTMGGFTLIEFILVVIVIGILSVAVAPQWTATSSTIDYDARRVLDDIRYTQALSMTTGQRYRWVLLTSNSYQIANEAGTAIILPNGSTSVTVASSITTPFPSNILVFNSQGVPYTSSGTAYSTVSSIRLIYGSRVRFVQINPETGSGSLA